MKLDYIGRYEVQRRLGAGGMGSVYLARDPALDRLVAIKLLKDEYQEDAELRERFLREARSVARLRHRNIVLVFDVGEHDGQQFMAMEYLPGPTLTKLLAKTPPLPLAQRLALAEQLCAGLAHAHAARIVHRDIKPSNAMLDAEGVLKILDFGIAHLTDSGITRDGVMMGSINYMSPEQIGGQRIDHRTDIFAVGAVLYELVTLAQAFPGGFDSGALNRILNEGHTPVASVVPGVDPALARIVDRALERSPEKRYQDADLMRRDLVQVRKRLPDDGDESEQLAGETIVVRPRAPSSPPSGEGPRKEANRPKDAESDRFGIIRRQQAEEHLRISRQALERGDHAAAHEAAERAAAIDPECREAFDLMDRTKAALDALAIADALDEADQLVADGQLTRAEQLIERGWDASALETPGAAELHARGKKLSEQVAVLRERRLRIESGLARARTWIDDRRFGTALRTISELLAIDPANVDARELQVRATSGLAAQREHELRRRQAYERIDFARSLATNHHYAEAAETLAAIMAPSDTVRRAVADAAAVLQEQKRAAERQTMLAEIRRQIDASEFEQALAAIDATHADERSREVRALRSEAENGLRARHRLERQHIELRRVMTAARELCSFGDFDAARNMVTEGFRLGGDEVALTEISQEISRAEASAEEQRVQENRDRTAARKLETARQIALRDLRLAIGFLENDDSGHSSIAAAVEELRSQAARQEREEAARELALQEERAARERAARERAEREYAEREHAAQQRTARERLQRAAAERQAREEAEQRERAEREREQQARLAAETMLVPAQHHPEETVVARSSPPRPVSAAKRPNIPLLGSLVAFVAVAVIGAIFVRGRPPEVPQPVAVDNSPSPVEVAPTTVPATPAISQPPPPSSPPAGPTELDRIVQGARSFLKQGDVSGAAQTINEALERTPQDAGVQAVVLEILRVASSQAQQAKIAADQANAASRPAYQEAMIRLRAGDAQRTARRMAPAIDEYATAVRLFGEAARAPQIVQLSTIVTTTIPAADPPANPTRPTTIPATVASSIATTTIAPTTTIVPSIDQDTVQRVLVAYGTASRTFNVSAIEQIYPGLPANSRLRLDALRRNFNYCDYTYSNIRIVSATATDATIRADNLESCKPKTGQRAIDTRVTQQIALRKTASGEWAITEVLGLQ